MEGVQITAAAVVEPPHQAPGASTAAATDATTEEDSSSAGLPNAADGMPPSGGRADTNAPPRVDSQPTETPVAEPIAGSNQDSTRTICSTRSKAKLGKAAPKMRVRQRDSGAVRGKRIRRRGYRTAKVLATEEDPESTRSRIRKQAEFYFSDANLRKDHFLRSQIEKDEGGFVQLALLMTFNRLRALGCKRRGMLAAILKSSTTLELSEDCSGVRRRTPLQLDVNTVPLTIYAEGLPLTFSLDDLARFFAQYGKVGRLDMPHHRETKEPRGFCFVEYATEKEALGAVTALDGKWPLPWPRRYDGRTLRVMTKQRWLNFKEEYKVLRRGRPGATVSFSGAGTATTQAESAGGPRVGETFGGSSSSTAGMPRPSEAKSTGATKPQPKGSAAGVATAESQGAKHRGCLMRVANFSEPQSWVSIRQFAEHAVSVVYCDYRPGGKTAHLRLQSPADCALLLEDLRITQRMLGWKRPQVTILTPEEELRYWGEAEGRRAERDAAAGTAQPKLGASSLGSGSVAAAVADAATTPPVSAPIAVAAPTGATAPATSAPDTAAPATVVPASAQVPTSEPAVAAGRSPSAALLGESTSVAPSTALMTPSEVASDDGDARGSSTQVLEAVLAVAAAPPALAAELATAADEPTQLLGLDVAERALDPSVPPMLPVSTKENPCGVVRRGPTKTTRLWRWQGARVLTTKQKRRERQQKERMEKLQQQLVQGQQLLQKRHAEDEEPEEEDGGVEGHGDEAPPVPIEQAKPRKTGYIDVVAGNVNFMPPGYRRPKKQGSLPRRGRKVKPGVLQDHEESEGPSRGRGGARLGLKGRGKRRNFEEHTAMKPVVKRVRLRAPTALPPVPEFLPPPSPAPTHEPVVIGARRLGPHTSSPRTALMPPPSPFAVPRGAKAKRASAPPSAPGTPGDSRRPQARRRRSPGGAMPPPSPIAIPSPIPVALVHLGHDGLPVRKHQMENSGPTNIADATAAVLALEQQHGSRGDGSDSDSDAGLEGGAALPPPPAPGGDTTKDESGEEKPPDSMMEDLDDILDMM